MTSLADQYSLAKNWSAITHPSEPNYFAVIGGSTFGINGDGVIEHLPDRNIVDVIEATGRTWRAFAEDATGTGANLNPPRGQDHFPFLGFTDITGNAARAANLLPGGPTQVIAALNAGVNFIWLTPNDCHNMHSCPVADGDAWMASWIPQLIAAMGSKRCLLLILFDEGVAGQIVYAGFSGTAAKTAYKSTSAYTHYSLLKLLETVWGGGDLGKNDVNAAAPTEFLR